ncbi:hypothetical protein LZ31DRAFT_383957 [Colletotrichum somersetense]|nr:hypothetical protein LZ31DRAFT_383957 [Colletotrichum somersetense]
MNSHAPPFLLFPRAVPPCMSSSTAGGMASSPRFSLACLCSDTLTTKALLASFWNNVKPPPPCSVLGLAQENSLQ